MVAESKYVQRQNMFFKKIYEESLVHFFPYFVVLCIREQIYKKKRLKIGVMESITRRCKA